MCVVLISAWRPCSNACKFTPAGGKLTIRTKLVIPDLDPPADDDVPDEADPSGCADADADTAEETGNGQRPSLANGPDVHRLSKSHLTQHNTLHAKPAPPLEWIVVRIEVTDTGCGIRPKDMVQSKLFCEYIGSSSLAVSRMLSWGGSRFQPDGAGAIAGR